MRPISRKLQFSFLALVILASAIWPLLASHMVSALTLTDRSVTVSTAVPSALSTHTFQFSYVSTSSVGSLVFQYCDNSPLFDQPCNAPAGIDVLGASLDAQAGNTGFSVDGASSQANKVVLTRVPASSIAVPSLYSLSNIVNPSTPGTTQFVRISTHASVDGTGARTDEGGVAFATLSPFAVGATVPPFLSLCVAITVAIDCSSGSGDSIDLGTLSTSQARTANSQFSVATNDFPGVSIYTLGPTMTAGNNTITAIDPASPSFPGFSQFGINLRDNTSPNIGNDPDGPGTITPNAGYNTPNFYRYQPGGAIASSTETTNYTRMTVSYIVNINTSQRPGVYATTVTYLALGQF